MNHILELLDSEAFKCYTTAHKRLCKRFRWLEALAAVDPTLFHGRSFIFNRATPRHLDAKDVPEGWAVLLSVGDYEGGELYLPHLGMIVPFLPGTAIFIRGGILPHEILAFSNGQRISVAHFVHDNVFNHVGVKISV